MKIIQLFNLNVNSRRKNTQVGRAYDLRGLAPTLTTMDGGNRQPMIIKISDMEQENKFCIVEDSEGKRYKLRIRKLTPKECLRLMDVRDEDADKMLEVNSKSQVYKQAGNSIVVACMEKIFHNLFIDPQPERKVVRMRQIPMF